MNTQNQITTIQYIITAPALSIEYVFNNKDDAQAFCDQLAQDYPNALIERWQHTSTFDTWDNGGDE